MHIHQTLAKVVVQGVQMTTTHYYEIQLTNNEIYQQLSTRMHMKIKESLTEVIQYCKVLFYFTTMYSEESDSILQGVV